MSTSIIGTRGKGASGERPARSGAEGTREASHDRPLAYAASLGWFGVLFAAPSRLGRLLLYDDLCLGPRLQLVSDCLFNMFTRRWAPP